MVYEKGEREEMSPRLISFPQCGREEEKKRRRKRRRERKGVRRPASLLLWASTAGGEGEEGEEKEDVGFLQQPTCVREHLP